MPVLNASRSPRNWKTRGRNPSRARMLDRRGKSANDVLAARTSSTAVAIWTSHRYGEPSPTIVLRHLAHHRHLFARIGQDAELAGKEADAQEDQAERRAHHHEHESGRCAPPAA